MTTQFAEIASGIHVEQIIRASSPEHVSEILQCATVDRHPVIPFGGRRSIATGNPIGPADTGMDMTGFRGIIAYEPADLTMSVRGGTTIAEIQAELGFHGQELPMDIPFPDVTTVGGLVATGFAGPRRLRSGTLRDLLIGCEYVRGDGLLAKAGGMVVKNVSGFEIPRFLHGSWGALAVLTSVNLKVTPKPRADGTVIFSFEALGDAVDTALRLIGSEPSIDSCVVERRASAITVAARAMGRPLAVSETIASFQHAMGSSRDALEADDSRMFWQDLVERSSEADESIVVALTARPREMAALTTMVDEMLAGDPGVEIVVSPASGSLRLTAKSGVEDPPSLLHQVARLGVSYVVDMAPLHLRSSIPAWGSPPEGMDLMRSVKHEFDPAGILNPGRLFV